MESGFGLYLIKGTEEEVGELVTVGRGEVVRGEVGEVDRGEEGEVDRGEEGEVDRSDWLTGLLPAKPK